MNANITPATLRDIGNSRKFIVVPAILCRAPFLDGAQRGKAPTTF
jgi:hypothetical protein